jgi:dTMP kinase
MWTRPSRSPVRALPGRDRRLRPVPWRAEPQLRHRLTQGASISSDPTRPPPSSPDDDGAGAGPHERVVLPADVPPEVATDDATSGGESVGLPSRIRAVLRVRDFRRLWETMALSSFGDWLGLLAITATARSLADNFAAQNFALGAVLLFRLLPAILLGPLAGAFADRFDRRKTMVVSDVLRFALFASIPVVDSLVWLFVAQFLIEAISLFWIPAKEASVPNLLRKDQYEPANQLSLVTTYGLTPVAAAVVFSLLTSVGDRLSSLIPHTDHNDLALYLNALTFLVAALVVWRLPAISGRRSSGEVAGSESFLASLRSGFSFAGHSPLVRGLVVGITGAFIAAGVVIATGQAYARALGGGDAAYGLLFGAVFIGLGLGIALGPSLARDLSRERTFGIAIVGAGIGVGLLAWTFALWIALLLVVVMGFFAGIAYLAGFTLIGTEIDDAVRGRVFALVQSLVRAALILSLAVAPFLVGLIGQHTADLGAVAVPVTGDRVLLFAGGLLAVAVGLVAYRQMDDRRPVPLVADVLTALRRDTTARRRLARGGVLIAFEGGEGAGKSTQVRRLQEWLTSEGLVARATFEPGATQAGASIRAIVLDRAQTGMSPRAEALLYAADRAQHVHDVLRPALDAGEVVVTDRFVDSSLAYQGAGRTIPLDEIRTLSRWATEGLVPDLTVLLDLPPEEGLARARGRAAADRLESESLDFHQRVRATFRALAEGDSDRYLVLDARAPVDELAAQIRRRVAGLLSGLPLQTLPGTSRGSTASGRDRAAPADGAPSHPHAQTGPTPQLHP